MSMMGAFEVAALKAGGWPQGWTLTVPPWSCVLALQVAGPVPFSTWATSLKLLFAHAALRSLWCQGENANAGPHSLHLNT